MIRFDILHGALLLLFQCTAPVTRGGRVDETSACQAIRAARRVQNAARGGLRHYLGRGHPKLLETEVDARCTTNVRANDGAHNRGGLRVCAHGTVRAV